MEHDAESRHCAVPSPRWRPASLSQDHCVVPGRYISIPRPCPATGLAGLLRSECNLELPQVEVMMRSDYARGTVTNLPDEDHLNNDVKLVCSIGATTEEGPDLFLVETKSVNGRRAVDAALSAMGIYSMESR